MKGFFAAVAALRKWSLASSRVYANSPLHERVPCTKAMFTGTSTFRTSTAYCGLLNSSMLRVTTSGFFLPNKFQKEWSVRGDAFRADTLNPGVLNVIDVRRIKRRIIEKNLDAVRAIGHQAANRVMVQKIREPSRLRVVVAAILIGQQQS